MRVAQYSKNDRTFGNFSGKSTYRTKSADTGSKTPIRNEPTEARS